MPRGLHNPKSGTASKAFDRVNHTTLFKQLGARGIPGYILRILSYWYKNQDMCIRWGDAYSAKFKVTNGVRQGGILSPYLFNVYVDELSEEVNKCNVGCNLNGLLINHIMYAQGRRSGCESGGGGGIHVNPERSFGGTNGEPPSEASQLRKGGTGGPPPENFKNLHGKWCNLRYS